MKGTDKAIVPVREKKKISQGSICAASKETRLMFALVIYNADPELLCAQIVDTIERGTLDLRPPT